MAFFSLRRDVWVFVLLFLFAPFSGCVLHSYETVPDPFATLFSMVENAGEAREVFGDPLEEQLQDGTTVCVWQTRQTRVIPAHVEEVRYRRSIYHFWDYYEVWVPDREVEDYCMARMVIDRDGRILQRKWQGNVCENFIRKLPAWFDPAFPGTRVPVKPAVEAGEASDTVSTGGQKK
jgi:hypothetical protein